MTLVADFVEVKLVTKAQANYRRGSTKQHCGKCGNFKSPSTCAVVKGKVSSGMLCDLFWNRGRVPGPRFIKKQEEPKPPPEEPPNGEEPPPNGDGEPTEGAVYGRKPPKPTSAWLLTRFIGRKSTDSKVEVIDMGKGQEYEFRHGEADQWPKEARRTGLTQLKQASWDGWWKLYLARRRKHRSRPDGKWKDPLGEAVEHRDDGYYVHTPGGRTLGPFDTRTQAGMEDMFWVNGAAAGDEDELFGEAKMRPPHIQSLIDIENALGIYSRISVPDYVAKDAGKLHDAIRKNDKKTMSAILRKHQKQMTKGDVQGGPKQVKVGSAPRSAIARAALYYLEHPLQEAEPGQGEQPADSSLARKLAKQTLKNKATIALPFRQLWRHKYIEKNYDAGQAWKLFYWATTHGGAGGKGFNPATRKAASKLMVSAFSRWAKADMKAKVKRADGVVEKPVGEISRAEFVKWFMGSAPAISESIDEAGGGVRLTKHPEFGELFFREVTPEELAPFRAWLKKNRGTNLVLYHGTSARLPIATEGLKPTSSRTAKSLQTRRGYVSLSVYPGMAETFGKMAYPREKITVWSVQVPVSALVPDTDQLKNIRMWKKLNVPRDLAASLVFGHGAQVKGKIDPARLSRARLSEAFVSVEHGRKPQMVQPKKPRNDATFDLSHRIAREQGQTFKTGQAVEFRFMHNEEKAPNVGGRFQQDIEPSGYYMTTAPDDRTIGRLRKAGREFTIGTARFRNPLVIDWGMAYDQSSWKYRLLQHYDAKKRALTKALLRDGYDGIVTVRRGVTSEIVALKGKPKMVESLSEMFVEQEGDPKPPKKKAPPPPPEDDEEEKTDLEKEEEKAEKIGYELKDVQAYYDMQIAMGLDQAGALVKTKRKFKVRRLRVSPTGKIMSDTIPNPEKERKKQAAQAPPPLPPEEPVGGGEGPTTGGTFPEGPKGPSGPQGPPTPGGEE